MIAYASLHTSKPSSQTDHEVAYQGYHRIAVECEGDFGSQPIQVQFPPIEESAEGEITYICIGTAEVGNGEALLVINAMPHIKLEKSADAPTIVVINELNLPENLNPIARIAYQLWYYKQMDASTLHPKLYEAINDALHNAGVPVIPTARGGAAAWDVKLDMLKLNNWA
jgi:hypothetical protein